MSERLQQTGQECYSELSDHFIITDTNEISFKPPTHSTLTPDIASLIQEGLIQADTLKMLQEMDTVELAANLQQVVAESLAESGSHLQQLRNQLKKEGIDLNMYINARDGLRALLQEGISPKFSTNE